MTLSLETLGFELRRAPTRDNSIVFTLETPFCWVTESPYDVFVEQINDKFHVFDDGLSMHEILVAGVDMESRYKWDSLRRIVSGWNVNFNHTGGFESFSSMDKARETISNYLRAMNSVDEWILDQVLNRKPVDTLVEDSKELLKRWWQTAEVVNHPKIGAIYGEQLEFDFKIKDTYVDVISPTKSASTIRKLVATPKENKTLVVIDDRTDLKTAEREKTVISMVSNAIMYTRLEQNASAFSRAA